MCWNKHLLMYIYTPFKVCEASVREYNRISSSSSSSRPPLPGKSPYFGRQPFGSPLFCCSTLPHALFTWFLHSYVLVILYKFSICCSHLLPLGLCEPLFFLWLCMLSFARRMHLLSCWLGCIMWLQYVLSFGSQYHCSWNHIRNRLVKGRLLVYFCLMLV
jgi:hypothetical protein